MITFKQFMSESVQQRKGDVLYSSPLEYMMWAAMRHHDDIEKLAAALQLPKRFMNQKVHAQSYRVRSGTAVDKKYMMILSLPIPDGMDSDELGFWLRVAIGACKKRFDVFEVQFKNKARSTWRSQEEFVQSIDRRRKSNVTDGDMMEVSVSIEGWHED